MFSKKDDFTDLIQFKIGERIDELQSKDYDCIEDLANLFQKKNDDFNWKPLHFLNTYYFIKNEVELITSKGLNSESDLNNLLKGNEKKILLKALKKNGINPIENTRPKIINQFVFLFPVISILGSMLISTFLITAKDYSGWIYLSGLVGIILSVGLFKLTSKLRTQFNPNSLLEYAKSTYVIHHKSLSKTNNSKDQLIQFLGDELELVYKKKISSTDSIPQN